MKRSVVLFRICPVAMALLLVLMPQGPLRAQSIFDVVVGGTASTLSRFGPVAGEGKYRGMDVYKWVLPNKNQFTATVNPDGEIVYAESDWFGAADDTGCDLAGLKFGVTTLADLRKRFGSDGFTFRTRRGSIQTEDGVVFIYSWEVNKVVVTFSAKISAQDNARVQAEASKETAADFAKLYAVSIASPAYARTEWGVRIGEASPPTKTVWK